MGNFFSKLFGKDESNSFSYRYEDNNSAIKRYVRRLYEIESELGEMGPMFSEEADQMEVNEVTDPLENIVASLNKLRVPGYCAYKLAEEGLILIHLLFVRMALLKSADKKLEVERQYVVKLDGIVEHLNETEDHFNLTLEQMTPYKTLEGEDIVKYCIQKYLNKVK